MVFTAMWYYLLTKGTESAIFLVVVGCISILRPTNSMESLEMGGASTESEDSMEKTSKGTSTETGDSMENGAKALEVVQTQSKDERAESVELREASCHRLECVMAVNLLQIVMAILDTLILWFLGFTLSSEDSFAVVMIILCVLGSILLGYLAVLKLKAINLGSSSGWMGISLLMGSLSSAICFLINAMLSYTVNPVAAYWVIVATAFTFLGGYLSSRPKPREKPLPGRQILRMKPLVDRERSYLEGIIDSESYPTIAHVFIAGYLTYWIRNLQVIVGFYKFQCGLHSKCSFSPSPAIVLVLIFFAEILVALNCLLLTAEWSWWWKLSFASGYTCMFMIMKSVVFSQLDFQLKISKDYNIINLVSFVSFYKRAVIKALGIMFATGAIGFFCALSFVTGLLYLQAFLV